MAVIMLSWADTSTCWPRPLASRASRATRVPTAPNMPAQLGDWGSVLRTGQPGQAAVRLGAIVGERPTPAAGIAAGRLDLDDVGPKVGQQPPAQPAGVISQIENAEGAERSFLTHRPVLARTSTQPRMTDLP